jgi:hypothetical protein
MGLGIIRGSICTACADNTGDDSIDARVKIRRIVNRRGQSFCDITNFPFLRSDLSFSITSAAHTYSGASYLPTTYKRVIAAYVLDGSDRTLLKEVGIGECYEWGNPNDNQGKPDEFCISRIESGYWEIKFNRLPDATYTIYFEIELQWVDVDESSSGDSTELLITKDYYDYFTHYCCIERFKQQGDGENYQLYNDEWFNPMKPQSSLLTKMLNKLNSPLKQKAVQVDMEMCGKVLTSDTNDYSKEKAC